MEVYQFVAIVLFLYIVYLTPQGRWFITRHLWWYGLIAKGSKQVQSKQDRLLSRGLPFASLLPYESKCKGCGEPILSYMLQHREYCRDYSCFLVEQKEKNNRGK